MPRKPRLDFPDTTHHLFSRGNGKQPIFLDDDDRLFFLRRLEQLRVELKFVVFAYCLMTNHFHLALKRAEAPLNEIMQRLLTAHTRFFNDKWNKVGHAFQGRFGSRPIMSDADLMGVIRYIHMNPVEAGMCRSPDAWEWSGHSYVIEGAIGLVDGALIQDLFGGLPNYRDFLVQPHAKHERPALSALAGSVADVLQGPSKTQAAASLRRDFIVAALECGHRQSEIAAYLGRTRAAVAMCLKRS